MPTAAVFACRSAALRDISPGEELTVGYVPVTQDIASRRADLVARHGFVCSCARCELESGADGANPSVVDMKRLADQAQEEARYEDAEAAARFVLKSDPTDGDAHHKIGTAMLGQGRWADAHAAWREGVAVAPDHPALVASGKGRGVRSRRASRGPNPPFRRVRIGSRGGNMGHPGEFASDDGE